MVDNVVCIAKEDDLISTISITNLLRMTTGTNIGIYVSDRSLVDKNLPRYSGKNEWCAAEALTWGTECGRCAGKVQLLVSESYNFPTYKESRIQARPLGRFR